MRDQVIDELVTANHILAHHGILDSFGHVSVRSPLNSDRFHLSRSRAPARVTADDILTLGLDAEPIGDDRKTYLERYIHSEIYRARPDVGAVVHSHSPSIIPYGVVVSQPLKPIYHMAAGIGRLVPVFDIADVGGPGTDMLIRDSQLGAALAAALRDQGTILMRGHGITLASGTLKDAVFNAVYIELNARLQTQAIGLGEVKYLSELEIDAAAATNALVIDRAWDNWCAELSRQAAGL